MFYVISYDIVNDEKRNKVAKVLKDYGSRVQYSVFEAFLKDEHLEQMLKRVLKLLEEQEDNFRVYRLCQGCRKEIYSFGLGKPPEEKDLYIV